MLQCGPAAFWLAAQRMAALCETNSTRARCSNLIENSCSRLFCRRFTGVQLQIEKVLAGAQLFQPSHKLLIEHPETRHAVDFVGNHRYQWHLGDKLLANPLPQKPGLQELFDGRAGLVFDLGSNAADEFDGRLACRRSFGRRRLLDRQGCLFKPGDTVAQEFQLRAEKNDPPGRRFERLAGIALERFQFPGQFRSFCLRGFQFAVIRGVGRLGEFLQELARFLPLRLGNCRFEVNVSAPLFEPVYCPRLTALLRKNSFESAGRILSSPSAGNSTPLSIRTALTRSVNVPSLGMETALLLGNKFEARDGA